METKLITDLPVKEAAKQILAEIKFYMEHNMKRSKEQIAGLIADYSDNANRTIEICRIVLFGSD